MIHTFDYLVTCTLDKVTSLLRNRDFPPQERKDYHFQSYLQKKYWALV